MSARAKALKTGASPGAVANGIEASVRPPQPVDARPAEPRPELAYLPAPDAPTQVPPPLVYPPVAEARPSSRPVFAVAFAALLLLVALGVLLVRQGMADDSDTAAVASSTPSAAGGADVISEVSFGPGLALSESQHVVFDHPVSSIALTVPRLATTAGGGAFNPRIGNLQILVGNASPINVPQSLHAGTSVTVHLPAATSRLDVVYVAYNAVVRSKPSSQHRAAALVTPLTLTPTAGMTSTLHIDGSNVTNIGCTSPDGTSKTCGSENAQGWMVTRGPSQQDLAVIAQLNLQK
jgi:hypothetical protein